MIKKSCNGIGRQEQLATPNQNWQSWRLPFFDDYLYTKRLRSLDFLQKYMMIKESCNLMGLEVQLAAPNQKWLFQMLPFFDHYLHVKNLRDSLSPSRDIDDQRILQSDWL